MRGWYEKEGFAKSFSKKESRDSVSDPEEITPETKHANATATKISFIVMLVTMFLFHFAQTTK